MRWLIVGLTIVLLMGPGMSQAQQVQQTGRDLAVESSMSVGAAVASVVYFPVKFTVGVVGAILGGVGGFVTGGNERTAEGIWRPMTGGTYFITPDVLEGQRPFLPFDGGPYTSPSTWPPYSGSMSTQPY